MVLKGETKGSNLGREGKDGIWSELRRDGVCSRASFLIFLYFYRILIY
ncbi:MAG: hypothetical protein ACFFCY_03250 [Promethearchaeota archaeon]